MLKDKMKSTNRSKDKIQSLKVVKISKRKISKNSHFVRESEIGYSNAKLLGNKIFDESWVQKM